MFKAKDWVRLGTIAVFEEFVVRGGSVEISGCEEARSSRASGVTAGPQGLKN